MHSVYGKLDVSCYHFNTSPHEHTIPISGSSKVRYSSTITPLMHSESSLRLGTLTLFFARHYILPCLSDCFADKIYHENLLTASSSSSAFIAALLIFIRRNVCEAE